VENNRKKKDLTFWNIPLKSVGEDKIISYARKGRGLADVTGFMRKIGIMCRISRG